MSIKTLINLTTRNGERHDITLNYDDATIEAISEAVIQLVHRHRMAEGDSITVGIIDVKD